MQSDYRGITMNNYQSYKDYKNSGRRTAGPREGSSPEVKRKPVKKTKASVISKARPSIKDNCLENNFEEYILNLWRDVLNNKYLS